MIKLAYSNLAQMCDLPRSNGNLDTDEGLETAVLISLFTDRRASDDDDIPEGADKRGWWGDAYAAITGDVQGSRLWLLARAKMTAKTPADAAGYAKEALQWLLDDGVARSVDVAASVLGRGIVLLNIDIARADGKHWTRKWEVVLGL